MEDSLIISFCVNDLDYGQHTGYAEAVDIDGMMHIAEWIPIRCYIKEPGKLKFGRLTIPFQSYCSWYGNRCWDAARISFDDAVRVIHYVRARGWNCESGVCELFDAFDSGLPITVKMLQGVQP